MRGRLKKLRQQLYTALEEELKARLPSSRVLFFMWADQIIVQTPGNWEHIIKESGLFS